MNLGKLGKVETADEYLNIAFGRAKKHSSEVKKKLRGGHFEKQKQKEFDSIVTVKNTLVKHLMLVHDSFPKTSSLDPFYRELIEAVIDIDNFRKSLAAVKWASESIEALHRQFNRKIRQAVDYEKIMKHKKAYYGRVSSIVKQIGTNLLFLDDARKKLKELPNIKTSLTTVVIAGFPNVGKTTILKALTGSAPQIAHYPFTTQQIMMGYKIHNGKKIQFVDTPGLLDKPLHKRNRIELQAILALKHVANIIVFVIDPTEACGYTIEQQKSLLDEISKNFRIPIIVVLNKTDSATEEEISSASLNIQKSVLASGKEEKNIKEIVSRIEELA